MGRHHLNASEKREDLKQKVETLRKAILQTSFHSKHKVALELGACGVGRESIATINAKMSKIPSLVDHANTLVLKYWNHYINTREGRL